MSFLLPKTWRRRRRAFGFIRADYIQGGSSAEGFNVCGVCSYENAGCDKNGGAGGGIQV